jgi:hypothetical protein
MTCVVERGSRCEQQFARKEVVIASGFFGGRLREHYDGRAVLAPSPVFVVIDIHVKPYVKTNDSKS